MAIYTKSEIATLTGKSKAHISVNIKRGKLIVSVDGDKNEFIDTSVENNAAVIKKWTEQEVAKNTPSVVEPQKIAIEVAKPLKKETKKKSVGKLEPKVEPIPKEVPIDSLDTAQKRANLENKIANTRHKELQSAKLRGESIPTVMVMGVISSLGAGFQLTYKSGAESLLMDFNHKYKIPPTAVAELKQKLIELINDSHAQGIDIAKQTINKILQDNASAEANKD